MKALVYQGAFDVAVKNVPDARIEDPKDAIVRITTTNICGSDLHMYEGRTDVEEGKVLGHENMGVVESVGDAVERIKVGDRVSLPFNIACGTCGNCIKGLTGFCLRANPGSAGAAYGYASMGPYNGGQAEYLRVPWADFNALVLPEGTAHELDYTMLSDIFPTGWHGVELAKMQPGETIVIYGAGPVGLMAAHAAKIKGASRVFVVDQQPDRLKLAEQVGTVPVDRSSGDAVEQITDFTGGGADRGVDAVGYQAHGPDGVEQPEIVLNELVAAVKPTGGIGVVGVYVPQDPGAEGELAKEGKLAFDYGTFFFKGQSMGTGQCNTKQYNAPLRDLIAEGIATPGFLVSHELSLDQAAEGYDHFDKREDGWTKVVLHP
ncbi:alcohol dehydrogenase catalytic domain-containing protein [Amycolatopsis rubida]|uniref:Alcohol dehydrogenase catalytic domain-containing protein n=1 Tax=Amycolatopsis rubida TaxID=112413 RepID=A0ABX0BU71_9PSEU|nr:MULTISPECIES: glutathione-independent formaldehyde dehydrogenase [Amycolatopsis]MYW94178.1 alcohol dehydrogenase catalytic domain-containing protein [Amycolatopsis rubida]NEC59167.1 alcohol dehydrogenase catalytic domain-containing protein [Amycolatopsis rubida]OAP20900.1 Glutathione-independent formaldehyde dehydrogenase [Amycolatopsis sp. M39]